MRTRRAAPAPLAERLAGLRAAVQVADGLLPTEVTGPARALLAKAGARTALGDATVVALAGATGSGKSSLFNALAGEQVSAPGVRRPTTSTAHGAVWSADGDDRAALLDWLGVPRRHLRAGRPGPLDGLVLLDLPDHDSTHLEHRLEVDRLVELVDVLVWVLDPQKYADGAVHERYLRPYAGHAAVLLVVLNQADRLEPAARQVCMDDLRALLDSEGLAAVPALAVSATTGLGLPELRVELERRVRERRAASERLAADVRAVADGLSEHCAGTPGATGKGRRSSSVALPELDRHGLVDALADAAGVPQVVSAVEGSVALRGHGATGWPVLRWTGRLRADPLRRLHLTRPGGDGAGARPARDAAALEQPGRTSLQVGGVQAARLSTAVRATRDAAGAGLSELWRDSLRRELAEREAHLPALLDRAVAGTDLDAARQPGWWSVAGWLQTALAVVAAVGALWLLVLVLLGYLQLDSAVPTPDLGRLPVPTALLLGGLLAGALLAALCRPLVRRTARRRAALARSRLSTRIGEVAETELVSPLAAQRAAREQFCQSLQRAAGG